LPVTYELTEGEKCKRTLKIEVSHDLVQGKFEEIYHKLKTEAVIPGFRKGKAPLAAIKSRFSKTATKDVLEDLLDESYADAIGQAGLDPVSYPKIIDIDFAEDKPLIYTAELEVKPVIKLEKYTGFTLKKPDDQVKDEEVIELMDYIRRKNSALESVDRPAAEHDFVTADLEILADSGSSAGEKEFKEVQLELTPGPVAGQFLKQLTGIKVDDQREVEIVYPADHFDKRFAGNTVKFLVRITAIKQLNLIPMNEEFFKQFGEKITTEEQFKDALREDIQQRKTKKASDELREEVIKEVIDKNRFDLPESLVERFLNNMVEDYRQRSKETVNEEELRNYYRPIGIRQIRWDILLREIAEKENIKAEQADIDVWLQRFADNYKMTLEEARKSVTDNRRIADVKETILEHKVIEFITTNSTVETAFSSMVESEA
jgi:trigger factor